MTKLLWFPRIKVFKESSGVISDGPCWVCFCDEYMYTGESFFDLLHECVFYWRHDRNLVG